MRTPSGWDSGCSRAPQSVCVLEHWWTLGLLLPVWIVIHGIQRLYQPKVLESRLDHAGGIIKSVSLGCLLVLALGFATHTDYFCEKRLVLGFAWLFTLALSLGGRLGLLRAVYRHYFAGQRRMQRIVIVGAGAEGTRFLQRIRTSDVLEYEVVAFVDDDPAKNGITIEGIQVHGTVEELGRSRAPSRRTKSSWRSRVWGTEGTLAMMSPLHARTAAGSARELTSCNLLVSDTSVETIDGVPTYDIRGEGSTRARALPEAHVRLRGVRHAALRLLPASSSASRCSSAVFSPGPVLFKQVRAGQFGREFTMCKFRTMKLETDDSISPRLRDQLHHRQAPRVRRQEEASRAGLQDDARPAPSRPWGPCCAGPA